MAVLVQDELGRVIFWFCFLYLFLILLFFLEFDLTFNFLLFLIFLFFSFSFFFFLVILFSSLFIWFFTIPATGHHIICHDNHHQKANKQWHLSKSVIGVPETVSIVIEHNKIYIGWHGGISYVTPATQYMTMLFCCIFFVPLFFFKVGMIKVFYWMLARVNPHL